MGVSLIILIFISFITTPINNNIFRNIINLQNFRNSKVYFDSIFLLICFGSVVLILGFIGGRPVEEPYLTAGYYFTFIYFFFILAIPFTSVIFTYFVYSIKKFTNKK
jgi:hypothetical protein